MSDPCIISVAITGSVPRKKDNPALPVTVPEQIESTHAAYEAGAALVHVHVRNEDETPSSDPEKFVAFQDGIRKHCPDIIVQFSTGGRGRALEQRGAMLHLRPDGSVRICANRLPWCNLIARLRLKTQRGGRSNRATQRGDCAIEPHWREI